MYQCMFAEQGHTHRTSCELSRLRQSCHAYDRYVKSLVQFIDRVAVLY